MRFEILKVRNKIIVVRFIRDSVINIHLSKDKQLSGYFRKGTVSAQSHKIFLQIQSSLCFRIKTLFTFGRTIMRRGDERGL